MANIKHVNSLVDREFRNTINQLIDSTNAQGKSIQDLVAEGQLTPKQYEDLIISINNLVKSGQISKDDLNLELKNEINNHEKRIKQTEENKADKSQVRLNSIPIGLNDASADLLTAIKGGTTVNVLSEPKPGSVSARETTFLYTGKNLFNKERVKTGTSQQSNTGNETSSAYHSLSEIIPVVAGTQVTQSHQMVTTFWDIDGKYISGEPQTTPYALPRTITVPDNAIGMKIGVLNTYLDSFQVERGSEATAYEQYKNKVKNLALDKTSINDRLIEERMLENNSVSLRATKFFRPSTNLFNKANINEDRRINSSTGTLLHSDIYSVSDFIEIKPNTTYTGKNSGRWATYDENQEFIETDTTYPFTSQSNAKYMRMSFESGVLSEVQLNEGDTLLPYEKWGYVLRPSTSEPFTIAPELLSAAIPDTPVNLETLHYGIDPKPEGIFSSETIPGTGSNDTLVLENTVHTDIYSWYDELVAENPNYIAKKLLGTDGVGNEIYQYHFKDAEWLPRSTDGVHDDLHLPKLLLFTGTHGQEKVSTYSQYNVLQQMCRNWQTNKHLEFLRWNTELIVVPVVCPTGFDSNTRKNHNGVDINRNFEANWRLISPEGTTYGGPNPLSEAEARIVNDLMIEHDDALCVVDYHSFYRNLAPNDDIFIWVPWTHEKVGNAARNMIRQMTRKWHAEHDFMPDNAQRMIGYTSESTGNATVTEQAKAHGLKSCTFETCERVWLESSGYVRNSTVNTMCAESYANFLSSLVFNLSR